MGPGIVAGYQAAREAKHELFKAGDYPAPAPDLFYTWQTPALGNACGTIACIHAVLNADGVELEEDSPLQVFSAAAAESSYDARGKTLESNEALQSAHCKFAGGADGAGSGE